MGTIIVYSLMCYEYFEILSVGLLIGGVLVKMYKNSIKGFVFIVLLFAYFVNSQTLSANDSLRLLSFIGSNAINSSRIRINSSEYPKYNPSLDRMLPGDESSDLYKDSLVDTTLNAKKKVEIYIKEKLDSLKQLADSFDVYFPVSIDSVDKLEPYGYDIFKRYDKNMFSPPPVGPVSSNYVLGPGDEITVSIWGDRELKYTRIIDREGRVSVPDLGVVVVNGVTLSEFKKSLTKKLSRVYSSLKQGSKNATTFIDVSVGKIRSVRVYVFGDVKRPGGYTLMGNSSPWNALCLAEGPTFKGSLRHMRLIRNGKHIGDIDGYGFLTGKGSFSTSRMENGDILFIPPRSNSVYLKGEVEHPAIFEILRDETLGDLIKMAGGLTEKAYPYSIQIVRWKKHVAREVIDVPFDKENGSNARLYSGDSVVVRETKGETGNFYVINGEVERPGRYELRNGITLSEAVTVAGGLTKQAYLGRVDVVHTFDDLSQELLTLNLKEALDDVSDTLLLNRDRIVVYSSKMFECSTKVSIWGEIKNQGYYDLYDGMDLEDILFIAGGFTKKAERKIVEVSRIVNDYGVDGQQAKVFKVELPENFEFVKDKLPFLLKNDDMIFVRKDPTWHTQTIVTVLGEVKYPGSYGLESNKDCISNIISRAGGVKKETAYLEGAVFRRTGGVGRIAINLKSILKGKKKHDIALLDKDTLMIPRIPKTVKVVGEVGLQTSVLYKKGAGIGYYIDNAGGLRETADEKRITVVLANGRVFQNNRWGINPRIIAGSKIVVPRKQIKGKTQIFQILTQSITAMTGVITIALLAKQL